jgi:hypothetical protein
LANLEVVMEEIEEIGDGGDATAKGYVQGFDFVPVRESPVGDDEGVGVADAREEVEDVGVEDSLLEHVGGGLVRGF